MINLANTTRNKATFRILKMDAGSWDNQSWTELPVPLIIDRAKLEQMTGTVTQGGYHVQSISRWCIPDEDRAQFYVDTGLINGSQVTAQDLSNTEIRIQVLDDEAFPSPGDGALPSLGWKTVFIGTCIYQTSVVDPGIRDSGRTTYYCAGILWRTRNWPMDRHSTANVNHAKGHPGYNYPLHGLFRKVIGNKGGGVAPDPFGDLSTSPDISGYYLTHALPIDGTSAPMATWTDGEAIRHALASSRSSGEPKFQTELSGGLFDGFNAWDIAPGDTCWDLLRRVCNRQRGRGTVHVMYVDSDTGTGPVSLLLFARPTHTDAITYNTALGYGDMALTKSNVIPAATFGLDAINVDIAGDHRITESGFAYDNRASSVFDALTVQGEKIQVLCNLNFFGSTLSNRWSTADKTAFGALTIGQVRERQSVRWKHVWRRYGINPGTTLAVTAKPGDSAKSIDYATNSEGVIVTLSASQTGRTSEAELRFLPDLPIYEGWKYTVKPPVQWDGGTAYLPPPRLPPRVMYRATDDVGGDPTWMDMGDAGFNVQIDDFGLYIIHGDEDRDGIRYLANPTDAPSAFKPLTNIGVSSPVPDTVAGFTRNNFNAIVGLELATRPQFVKTTSGASYEDSGRRLTLTIPGVHLWLAAPGALYEYDWLRQGVTQKCNPAYSFPSGSDVASVIRDDRDALSFIAALAWEYYGKVHNPGTWALYDCGLLGGFSDAEGKLIAYPALGQLVHNVTYAGTPPSNVTATLDTPITSIHYEHDVGMTTWRTDYISYNGAII